MTRPLIARLLKTGAAALSLGFFGAHAGADVVLLPGASNVALTDQSYNNGASPVAPGAVEIASTMIALSLNPNSGLQGVTVTEAVYRETGGTLDFLYQVNNTSGNGAVTSLALTNFNATATTPFTTNVGFTSTLPTQTDGAFTTAGTTAPGTAERTTGGGQITFNFTNAVAVGTTSTVFYVRTNATAFNNGGVLTASGADSNAGNLALQPTLAVVPEPGTASLLAGLGVAAGVGSLVRRRARF